MKNLIFFIKYLFRLIVKKNSYDQKHFPLGYLDKNLSFKKSKEFFFTNPYLITSKFYPFIKNFYASDIITNMTTSETIKSSEASKSKNIIKSDESLLIVATKDKFANLIFSEENELQIKKKIYKDKNYYLHLKKDKNYKICSNKQIFFSDIFPKNFVNKEGIKLNLVLFVDGLSSKLYESENKNLIKHTNDFFEDGLKFKNHYCNSEWSLPSGANIFSGCHFQKHKLFHNNKFNVINENLKLLPEIFDEQKYMTCMINGSHRLNPSYGFSKGFKRTLYKQGMKSIEVIDNFFEFEKLFKNTNKFLWLTFFDLHEAFNYNSILSNFIMTDNKNKTKIDERYNDQYIKSYFDECKNLDEKLKMIYDYINRNYKKNEILVSLISDHGQTFFDNDEKWLKNNRIKIPWMLKGKNVEMGETNEITENIDILPTFANLNNFNFDYKKVDGNIPSKLGGYEKKFALTQSIYPNKTYKTRISYKNKYFDFETNDKIDQVGKIKSGSLKSQKNDLNSEDEDYKSAYNIVEENIKKLLI